MTPSCRRSRPFLVLPCLLLAWVTVVHAQGVPSPANSTVPAMITLVGSTNGVPAPQGAFEVVIRDLANNPVPGAAVDVDLSLAYDLHFCVDPLDPGVTADCASKRVRKITDALGRVRFILLGGSVADPVSRSPRNSGQIFWDGLLIGRPTVAAYDLDGMNGLGANDLSIWLDDFARQTDLGRGDYDGSGAIGANDLSLWLQIFASGDSLESCATSCP